MASPSESKIDETEVTSEHQSHRREGDGDDQEIDLAFPLMRQSSIYSLTLDEIQNTVCEPGKSFGSMNMDEFLNNIWSVEEGFAANIGTDSNAPTHTSNGNGGPPLLRQGSLTLPAPLCRKTVDEVWADIHREQAVRHLDRTHHGNAAGNTGNAPRQPTFGEMTLEDFLIKAGVVREGYGPSSPHPPPTPTYGLPNYQMGGEGPGFGHVVGPRGFEYHQVVGDGPVYAPANGKRFGNGYAVQQVRLGSPVSPVSSDGLGGGQVDNSAYGRGGMERGGAKNGRKRMADGVVEKVVERRQRRMIKNRESAARSRARKQAYTVELEAELNQLKEENVRLKEEERRAQQLRKQMLLECMAEHAQTNAEKTARSLRRSSSGPW